MTMKFQDDTTGKLYGRDVLEPAAVCIEGTLFDDLDYHPDKADFDELRRQLHDLVDEAVDDLEAEANDGN